MQFSIFIPAFFIILVPYSCQACDYFKKISCSFKAYKYKDLPDKTFFQKLDELKKWCSFFADECGQVMEDCEDDQNMKKKVESILAGCPIINRMLKDDFVDCAIVLQQEFDAGNCEIVRSSYTISYAKAMFEQCLDNMVQNKCSSDQNRIYKAYREMAIEVVEKNDLVSAGKKNMNYGTYNYNQKF
ncbi:unnamed protein product [Caenorhabditis angaria]|uniref:DUF19 domain-containing protein n=1 Tax=Caenorhabditis angaria TaxID=860376 RepID=A0A9P1IK18_9PELO|nr:unnamed protein product [Caenorhabditis angaria]